MKKKVGIINLDTKIGQGTHWVTYRNIGPDYIEYFDSFGLIMSFKVADYLNKSGKPLVFSGDKIQERDSVLCGYWGLYYLTERQRGRSILEIIHNARFDLNAQRINNRFIINYFKNM